MPVFPIRSVPAESVVVPEWVLLAVYVVVPDPASVRLPVPLIGAFMSVAKPPLLTVPPPALTTMETPLVPVRPVLLVPVARSVPPPKLKVIEAPALARVIRCACSVPLLRL